MAPHVDEGVDEGSRTRTIVLVIVLYIESTIWIWSVARMVGGVGEFCICSGVLLAFIKNHANLLIL